MLTGIIPRLTIEEMRVVVEEVHKQGRKVAAHAYTPEGIRNALILGVDSIEHGNDADRATLEPMKGENTYWGAHERPLSRSS
jgi:imidazolonepropionase-like amidohydrolase